MNRRELDALDGTTLINGLANDVHDTAESSGTDGNLDGCTGVKDLLSANETLCTVHGNGTDRVLTQVSSDLEDETATVEVLDFESIENRRKVLSLELDVDDGTNNCFDVSDRRSFSCIRAGLTIARRNWKDIVHVSRVRLRDKRRTNPVGEQHEPDEPAP